MRAPEYGGGLASELSRALLGWLVSHLDQRSREEVSSEMAAERNLVAD